jgi:hypothetical protein
MIDLGKVISEVKAATVADLETDKQETLISKQSPGTKAFKKVHKVNKIEDRNGNKDDVFNATKVKPVNRQPDHGYNPSEDEDAYFPSQNDSIDPVAIRAGIKRTSNGVEESVQVDEVAPPGKEKMVKAIKKEYAKDSLTNQEKAIAYATAWKAYNKGK